MMLAMLLQAAAPVTAIEAERALAEAVKREGQSSAMRRFAASNAVIFAPRPVSAQEWLKRRGGAGGSAVRWPIVSYVSCDNTLAINRGGWRRRDGSVGYFSTVWQREADGRWRWIVDGSGIVTAPLPMPSTPRTLRASCLSIVAAEVSKTDGRHGAGASRDKSLLWEWALNATGRTRVFSAYRWNGAAYADAIEDVEAAK